MREDGSADAARAAYAAAYDAWMRVEVYRFGPVEDQNAVSRVNFWPVAMNYVGRALGGDEGAGVDNMVGQTLMRLWIPGGPVLGERPCIRL